MTIYQQQAIRQEQCVFCDPEEWRWRTIQEHELFVSFVSNPRFREGQCLVIPKRHLTQPSELTTDEAGTIMLELGRLAGRLDAGFGSGTMQKYQPNQPENGVKMNHLHYHVFPRYEVEPGLFPIPEPNSFDGFQIVPREDIQALAESLK